MQISDSLAREILDLTKENSKPRIEVGNYLLIWDGSSMGIPPQDENNLRGFVKDLVPHISSTFYSASIEFHKSLKQHAKNPNELRYLQDAFHPQVILSKSIKSATYSALIDFNGRTLITRTEEMVMPQSLKSTKNFKVGSMAIESELGELVYNRQGRSGQ